MVRIRIHCPAGHCAAMARDGGRSVPYPAGSAVHWLPSCCCKCGRRPSVWPGQSPQIDNGGRFGQPFEADTSRRCGRALLHKSAEGRTSPFPGQIYPTSSVTGMPSAVKRFRAATRIWNSATWRSKSPLITHEPQPVSAGDKAWAGFGRWPRSGGGSWPRDRSAC